MKLRLLPRSWSLRTLCYFGEQRCNWQGTFPMAPNHETILILNKLWNRISWARKEVYVVWCRQISFQSAKANSLKCAKTILWRWRLKKDERSNMLIRKFVQTIKRAITSRANLMAIQICVFSTHAQDRLMNLSSDKKLITPFWLLVWFNLETACTHCIASFPCTLLIAQSDLYQSN